MFLRAQHVPQGSQIHADICVIGAGAAGISFAREFLDTPTTVCILESGEVQTSFNRILIGAYRLIYRLLSRLHIPKTRDIILKSIVANFGYDAMYDFEHTGLPVAHQSRRRSFGGSMIAWGGKWAQLEPIDFKQRSWVPNSGWPITQEELAQYYVRASKSVQAPDPTHKEFDENFLGRGVFETVEIPVQKKSARNWGKTLYRDFEQSQNISVYTGAHVVSINKESMHIESVSIKTTAGSVCTVRAKYFVLACGGIENARLLLASNIGNEHDQVGRYYMDHPRGKCGTIEASTLVDLSRYWGQGTDVVGFRLSDDVQEKEGILNSHIFLESLVYESSLLRKLKALARGKKTATTIIVRNHLEQVPSATNRVTLSSAKDTLGIPKAQVAWSLNDLDKKSIVVLHRYLAQQVEQAGIGKLHSPLLTDNPSFGAVSEDAAHHMGTTRMGQDPRTSVVDPNCKIHALDNMFVAGSSTFSTGGSANPTATICALAVRLADHIKRNV
ncbi:MAG TPA: GMC family oxidoreductase [Candidatus Paceibacterota bacterium]|jgi:choline dehydrogenase-like flavoprotein|nr:GMC family oxidoreductase [Candidatus Paceibacterota bacterium]